MKSVRFLIITIAMLLAVVASAAEPVFKFTQHRFVPFAGTGIDCTYTFEHTNRYGIMTSALAGGDAVNCVPSVEYSSVMLHLRYRLARHWRVFANCIYETAGIYGSVPEVERGCYRTSWGYIGGIEFYPVDSSEDLHFFAAYECRTYNFADRAKILGQQDYTTSRLSIGLVLLVPGL